MLTDNDYYTMRQMKAAGYSTGVLAQLWKISKRYVREICESPPSEDELAEGYRAKVATEHEKAAHDEGVSLWGNSGVAADEVAILYAGYYEDPEQCAYWTADERLDHYKLWADDASDPDVRRWAAEQLRRLNDAAMAIEASGE